MPAAPPAVPRIRFRPAPHRHSWRPAGRGWIAGWSAAAPAIPSHRLEPETPRAAPDLPVPPPPPRPASGSHRSAAPADPGPGLPGHRVPSLRQPAPRPPPGPPPPAARTGWTVRTSRRTRSLDGPGRPPGATPRDGRAPPARRFGPERRCPVRLQCSQGAAFPPARQRGSSRPGCRSAPPPPCGPGAVTMSPAPAPRGWPGPRPGGVPDPH